MLNLNALPDLSEVKAQVDRIDLNVAETAAKVDEMRAKVDEIHAVFSALAPIVAAMPMDMPSGPVSPFSPMGIIQA